MKHLQPFGWIGRHKVASSILAVAFLGLVAALALISFEPRETRLETFLEPASAEHREAKGLIESNQPVDAEARCRQAIEILDRAPSLVREDARFRLERGAILETLASIQTLNDRPDLAVESYQQAIDSWSRLLTRDQAGVELRKRSASCETRLAPLLVQLGRWEDAEKALERGDAVCQTQVTAQLPDPQIHTEWVEVLNQLGLVLLHKDKWSEALDRFKVAKRVQAGLIQPDSGTGLDRERLALILVNQAQAYRAGKQPAEAERALIESREIAQKLTADFADTLRYQDLAAMILETLAELFEKDPKRITEARGLLENAVSIREKFATNRAAAPEYVVRLAETYDRLAELHLAQKSFKESEAYERKELDAYARLEKEHPSDLVVRFKHGRSLHNLADFLRERGRAAEALPLERQAIERLVAVYKDDVLDPDHRRALSYAYWSLCTLELGRGDYRAAAGVVEEYQKIEPCGYEEAYESARFLCRAISLCNQDQGISASEHDNLVRAYADRAMAALGAATEDGFHDLSELTSSHTYDPLRGRPDFARLVKHIGAIVEALNEK
jgi:tetratricopeptide (TPR) repeat protein